MVVYKGSDLILEIEDITDVNLIKVYTTNVTDSISITDISNKIHINAADMENFHSGVITYRLYKSKSDTSFGDKTYDTYDTIYTDIYFVDIDENGSQHKKAETVEEYVDKKIDGFEQEIEDKAKEIADTVDGKIKVETDRATTAETTNANNITKLDERVTKIETDGAKVKDVQMDGTSLLNDNGVANIVSGTNIKTINNVSILGEGNIEIESGGDYPMTVSDNQVIINNTTNTASGNKIGIIGVNNNTDTNDECLILGNDNSTVAKRSVIMGRNNSITSSDNLSSFHPYVFGASNTLKGVENSYVIGYSNVLNGAQESTFVGDNCTYKLPYRSTCLGFNNGCSTIDRSFISGTKNTMEYGIQSAAIGISNTLTYASYCSGIGFQNTIKGTSENYLIQSTAVGAYNTVNSKAATAVGYHNTTTNDFETSLGFYNLSEKDKTYFSVGNGSEKIQHNLLYGNKDGDLYIVEKTNEDGDTTNYYERSMKRLQTWFNEKADTTDLATKQDKITSTTSTDTSITLKPNTNIDITCSGDLTITLEAPTDTDIVNIYMCTITTSGEIGTITLPTNITWNDDATIEPSSFYEINIRYSGDNYFGIIHKWNND